MKNYKWTLIGLALAIILYLIVIVLNLDLFEALTSALESAEYYEIDEIIIPLLILIVFIFFDYIRKKRLIKIEREKIKIYKAMMSSSYRILNNYQLQMHYFKMAADNTPGFDPVVLSLYETVIKRGSEQIKALGSINNIDEESILATVAPKSNPQTDPQQDSTEDKEIPSR